MRTQDITINKQASLFTHLKDHGHGGAHLDDLRVWQAQLLVVVKHLRLGVHAQNKTLKHK